MPEVLPDIKAEAAPDRIIHIGAPKCGSTALQATFHANREQLHAAGVRYIGRPVHWIEAAKAAAGVPDRITRKVPPIRHWRQLVAEVEASRGSTALISSEWFSSASDAAVAAILDDLDRRRVRAVLVVRPIAKILPSAWQQGLKLGGHQRFAEWLHTVLHQADDPRSQRFWRIHRHDALARRWASALGPDRLTVIVADDRDPDFVVSAFSKLLGLGPGILARAPERTNPSLSAFEAEVLAELNRVYFEQGGTLREYRTAVMRTFDGYVNHLRVGAGERIAIPAEEGEAVRRIGEEIAQGIRATGAVVVGDLDRLTQSAPSAATSDRAADPSQRADEVRSAARMLLALMITAGMVERARHQPGFGRRSLILRHQAVSLVRRTSRLLRETLRRRR